MYLKLHGFSELHAGLPENLNCLLIQDFVRKEHQLWRLKGTDVMNQSHFSKVGLGLAFVGPGRYRIFNAGIEIYVFSHIPETLFLSFKIKNYDYHFYFASSQGIL